MRVLRALYGHVCQSPAALSITTTTCRLKPLSHKFPSVQARSITLRPYQEESIQAVLSHLQRGHKRLGISLATGAGKTVIFSQLIGRINPRTPDATRTLILVHRKELVEQAFKHCEQAYPNLIVEVEMGKMRASGRADITIASVQSLTRGRLVHYDPALYKMVLVDEAHHVVSQTYLSILEHFSLLRPTDEGSEHGEVSGDTARRKPDEELFRDSPVLVGVSATFSRFDGLSLGHAVDYIVYHKDYIDLINESWLSDVRFSTVKFKADLSRVKSRTDGDFLTKSLSEAVNTSVNNRRIVGTWQVKAEGRKSTVVFAVDVAHVKGLEKAFREHGVDARSVTGSTPMRERSNLVQGFKEGEFPVLINCGIFTEGTDIPNIDCVLLARPTKSRNLLVQMIGRGMRKCEGKEDCHVIDMVSALNTGIITVPTLFGLDPTTLLENEGSGQLEARKLQNDARLSDTWDETSSEDDLDMDNRAVVKDYDSVMDLIQDEPESKHLRQLSHNNWVQVYPDEAGKRYILQGNVGFLKIVEHANKADNSPEFSVFLHRVLPEDGIRRPVYLRPKSIAQAKTLEAAVHAGDTYADDSAVFPRHLVRWRQAWRERPATEKQLKFLQTLLPTAEKTMDLTTLTAGQCNNMVTRIKFGAKGYFNGIKARWARESKTQEKVKRQRELSDREMVKVGPLSQASFSP